jgi:hypothetical protein
MLMANNIDLWKKKPPCVPTHGDHYTNMKVDLEALGQT